MTYLVDTHILMWSFFEPERLSSDIQGILLDSRNIVYYSPVNLWEISIKYGLGKLTLNGLTPEAFFDELNRSFFICKDIKTSDIITSYKLPMRHKDPFDRLIIWEAIKNNIILISADDTILKYKDDGLNVVSLYEKI